MVAPGQGVGVWLVLYLAPIYSQVYKVLPEFDYPASVQDPQPCSAFSWDYAPDYDIPGIPFGPRQQDFFPPSRRHHLLPHLWRHSEMDTYKLFQVEAHLCLLVPIYPGASCGLLRVPGKHSNVL